MKHALVLLAIARAVNVFPTPGTPYNIQDLGVGKPNFSNFSGKRIGSSIISLINLSY